MKKKPVKKASSAKVASIAGKWLDKNEIQRMGILVSAAGACWRDGYSAKKMVDLINDIDALAASVLSQREVK